jgi:hypothetical protein
MAERLRNLGKFTFADIAAYRFDQTRSGHLRGDRARWSVVCFYLIAQMVGAGQLIKLLFGLEYNVADLLVGILMMVYVTFGGMVRRPGCRSSRPACCSAAPRWRCCLLSSSASRRGAVRKGHGRAQAGQR